jgi:replication-associated recombination protein RarA
VKKSDHVSKRLPYSLEPGDHSAWDELVGTLYNVEEREKIEWFIGAIVSGDSTKIQKAAVFYGPPGSGKGTVLDIILKMFIGYTTTFDAAALGNPNKDFATESFARNPLVAVQGDGDLSRIERRTSQSRSRMPSQG